MNGEFGNLPAKSQKKARVKTEGDPKIGTKWTAAEDELLTSLYGHYDDTAVKRNLNHRTWGGIVSRAKRLKLKSRKVVLRERRIAQVEAEREGRLRKLVGIELNKLRKRVDKLPYVPREAQEAIKTLYDRHQSNGKVTVVDVAACKETLDKIPPKTWAEKLEVETAVREAAEKTKQESRGVNTLSPVGRTFIQRIGDAYNISRMRTTTDPKEYDLLEKMYGKTPWLPDSEWGRADKAFIAGLASRVTYPGPWQDKVVTKPPERNPQTLPWNIKQVIPHDSPAFKLMKKTHDDLVKRGITMPDIDPPQLGKGALDYITHPLPSLKSNLPCLLAGTRVYLCGAMDRVSDGGVGWRKRITPRLQELGVVIFDPTEKPFYNNKGDESDRKMREGWIRDGEYDKLREFVKDFRGGDLRMINNCDFVIIYIDVNSHMCGSYEEIAIANHEKKPVLVVCEQGKKGVPQWLFGMLPHEHFFGNFDELMSYLQRIDEVGLDDDTGRWYFYRPEVLFPEYVFARLKQRSV